MPCLGMSLKVVFPGKVKLYFQPHYSSSVSHNLVQFDQAKNSGLTVYINKLL